MVDRYLPRAKPHKGLEYCGRWRGCGCEPSPSGQPRRSVRHSSRCACESSSLHCLGCCFYPPQVEWPAPAPPCWSRSAPQIRWWSAGRSSCRSTGRTRGWAARSRCTSGSTAIRDQSAPAGEPVVAFEGGPGYPSIGSAASYLFMLGSLHQTHDLIVMDQRGTGTSDPIRCPDLQNGIGNYVAGHRRLCAPAGGGRQRLRHGRGGRRHGRHPAWPGHPPGGRLRRLVRHLRGPGVHRQPPAAGAGRGARRNVRQLVQPVRARGVGIASPRLDGDLPAGGLVPRDPALDRRVRPPAGGASADRPRQGCRRLRRARPPDADRLCAARGRRHLHLHDLPRPARRPARLRARRPRADAAAGGRGRLAERRRGQRRRLLGGRSRGGLMPRLPDDLERRRVGARAARAAQPCDRGAARGRLCALLEAGVARRAGRERTGARVPGVAGAEVPRPAVSGRPAPAHPGARARRRVRPGDAGRGCPHGGRGVAGLDLRPVRQHRPHQRPGRLSALCERDRPHVPGRPARR